MVVRGKYACTHLLLTLLGSSVAIWQRFGLFDSPPPPPPPLFFSLPPTYLFSRRGWCGFALLLSFTLGLPYVCMPTYLLRPRTSFLILFLLRFFVPPLLSFTSVVPPFVQPGRVVHNFIEDRERRLRFLRHRRPRGGSGHVQQQHLGWGVALEVRRGQEEGDYARGGQGSRRVALPA